MCTSGSKIGRVLMACGATLCSNCAPAVSIRDTSVLSDSEAPFLADKAQARLLARDRNPGG